MRLSTICSGFFREISTPRFLGCQDWSSILRFVNPEVPWVSGLVIHSEIRVVTYPDGARQLRCGAPRFRAPLPVVLCLSTSRVTCQRVYAWRWWFLPFLRVFIGVCVCAVGEGVRERRRKKGVGGGGGRCVCVREGENKRGWKRRERTRERETRVNSRERDRMYVCMCVCVWRVYVCVRVYTHTHIAGSTAGVNRKCQGINRKVRPVRRPRSKSQDRHQAP